MNGSEFPIPNVDPFPLLGRIAKRAFDVVVDACGLIRASPLFVVMPIVIKATSHGSVFYRANRVGQFRHEFAMIKFRTMTATADLSGPLVTGGDDPSITRAGTWMRKMKIEKIPQFYNVLADSMSVVGPRQQSPPYIQYYGREGLRSLAVKPGLTSPAMIVSQESLLTLGSPKEVEQYYVDQLLPKRIERNLAYIDYWSFSADIKCVYRTIRALFSTDTSRRHNPIGNQKQADGELKNQLGKTWDYRFSTIYFKARLHAIVN